MHQDKGGALTFDIVFNVPAFKFKGVRKIPTTQFKLLEYSAVVMEEESSPHKVDTVICQY